MACGARPAAAWRATWRGTPHAIAVGPRDVVAVAGTRAGLYATAWDVSLRSAAGAVRWRFRSAFGVASAVTFDGAGDVLVAGTIAEANVEAFGVVKLDGRRGKEQWRYLLPAGAAVAVATTPAGDVVVAGASEGHLVVVGLDAAGAPRWRATDVPATATSLAVDGAGASVVGAANGVTRLEADGAVRWRVASLDTVTGVAIAADGDVVVATTSGGGARRLAAANGAERWRMLLEGGATAVAVDGAGDVLVAGSDAPDTASRFVVVKVGGADGSERWRLVAGAQDERARAVDVACDANGDVGVAGTVGNVHPAGPAFGAFAVAGDTGQVRARRIVDVRERYGSDVDEGVAVTLDRHARVAAVGLTGGRTDAAPRGVLVRLSRR